MAAKINNLEEIEIKSFTNQKIHPDFEDYEKRLINILTEGKGKGAVVTCFLEMKDTKGEKIFLLSGNSPKEESDYRLYMHTFFINLLKRHPILVDFFHAYVGRLLSGDISKGFPSFEEMYKNTPYEDCTKEK